MAWQEPPVHRDYAPARLVMVVAITVVIVMALREHRDSVGGLVRAAEYVRMSTEHQQYSTENQHAAIQRYADEHGMMIVRTFTDAGKSGVGIHGRDALQELLRIVNSGTADFAAILVYDVSRWGRFQDADEAAHYEFQCKRRKVILRAQGTASARCLVAKDDEAYTYNKRINPLSTIQEHHMIVKAINDGVSEERIAAVLHIDLKTIQQKRDLLLGICTEAADILKDKPISAACFNVLRKMTAMRQIEAAELMTTMSNFSLNLTKTILAASTAEQLAKPGTRKAPRALTSEQLAQLEQEMSSSQAGLAALKDTYGADRLELQVACRYLSTILGNARIRKYLLAHHADLIRELEQITTDVTGEQAPS